MVENSLVRWVREFQTGNREAFAKLVAKFQNLVTSVAYSRTGDLQRSEDIAQQTFLIAWQKQEELKQPERFGAWVRGIASNLALNEVRLKENQSRKRTQNLDGAPEPSISDEVDSAAIRSEQNELLWSTLERIPEIYREPIILFYREGQSVAAVAEQMDLSEDAVKQRLSRGRAMMKNEIESLVKNMLYETRPQEAFCAGVISLLSTNAAPKVAAVAAGKVTAATGSKSLLGPLGAGATTGATAGLLGALFGLIAGIGGAWIGTRQGIKHATSEEEKDLHYLMFNASVLLSLVYSAAVLLLVTVFRDASFYTIGMIFTNAGFFLALGGIIFGFIARQKRLHQVYGKPQAYTAQKQFALSPLMLRINSMGSMLGAWAWIVVLMIIIKAWVLFGVSLAGMTLFLGLAWILAPTKRSRAEALKLNANLCLFAMLAEGVIMGAGSWFGLFGKVKSYDNVPLWAVAIAVPIFGLVMFAFLRFLASRQTEILPHGPEE